MTHLITALMDDIHVPYGVNVLWNPTASIDLAVGASFVREIFSGVCASDFGLWNTNFGEVIRYQHPAGGQKIRLLFKIVPEAAAHLAGRDSPSIAKSTVFNHRPDDLCVSGLTAGVPTVWCLNLSSRPFQTPVPCQYWASSRKCGASAHDRGWAVGTTIKQNAVFENPTDPLRIKAFMKKVKDFRRNYQQ